ncbi:MAG: hypothetical protein II937_10095 [Bacteroidales bacterium]|nr:hypothetical protein [Bacteroidales bacterium]
MKTITKSHLKDIYTSLDNTQIVWSIKFLTDILAGQKSEHQKVVIEEEKDEPKEEIPDPKPIWWDYPISPEVMAMAPKERKFVSGNYKEDLYNALVEKYESIR